MLRDIRTRFFGHGLGYLIAIAWPLVHIGVLMAIWAGTGRVVPLGNNVALYFGVVLLPVISFMYASRWIMLSAIGNKPLLYFPIVKLIDVLVARALLEAAAACVMTVALFAAMASMGFYTPPASIVGIMQAMGASILLGVGCGMVNGVVALGFPLWATGYQLLLVIIYLLSGVVFVVDDLPEIAREILAWNPVLHGVEWMKSAYFGVHTRTLDRQYMLSFGASTLFIALLLERYVGRRLMKGG
ncbi:ABC transporter permease [Enterovirga sp. CN4-39]|uniref:ABC transporter permease n=1 Tax=Enterovirga sp. CN4-39 TaxID=3400910 RepID=UPI003C042A20